MNTTVKRSLGAMMLVGTMALGACSGMTPRERDTAVGAAVGGAAGAVMTDGVLGTVGGAAVGGVIGNQVGKHRHER
ncbi:MAG: glycine zipper 2TM domain-containing protein [Burkholderiaceae bacterium]